MTDFLGREIKLGSEVVYPGRSGSSLWMNYGFVDTLGENCIRVRPVSRDKLYGKPTWVKSLERVVVVGVE